LKAGKEKYYLLLISIHGLIRGHDMELGRDADTGGQTKYVLDLARSLASHDNVERVDLVTRRISDPAVSADYAVPIEDLSAKARIVRIEAGPPEYLAKERLWDHLDSFMDNLLLWLNEQKRMPDLIHSHYADAGYVGVRLTNLLGVPLIHTGHSLGRDKRQRLLAKGLSQEEIENTYNIKRRIEAEEEVLANAALVVTSTRNEIETQYELYQYYDPSCMVVIPPGTDMQQFHPPRKNEPVAFAGQLRQFLKEPEKPIILALSRPDERKNILTLIDAYGESQALQQAANLVIVAGTRDDIRELDVGAQNVLTQILLLIDAYDLYGKVAIPKHHRPEEVPDIYRLAAASGGIFVNPALTEPFGLTLLEAAACGLPVVATENGGPVDIIGNCHNGELVDPLDSHAIRDALLGLLDDRNRWLQASRSGIKGVRQHYTWQAHTDTYLRCIGNLKADKKPVPGPLSAPGMARFRDRAIFSDLDQNLLGDPETLQHFSDIVRENHRRVSFGIATGRRIDSALAVIKRYHIPLPDILISSMGTRIHYGKTLTEDDFWSEHIDHDWKRNRIHRVMSGLPGIQLQPGTEQSEFKLSYYYDPQQAPSVDEITALIRQREIAANVVYSFGQFIDIVPSRASKGQALRYVMQRLDIALDHVLVAGGSGADTDMMRGNTLAVVVANRHHEELSQLENLQGIYFAEAAHAAGILEAMEYYDFFGRCAVPESA
jgi:sucrose-phosphate synthase